MKKIVLIFIFIQICLISSSYGRIVGGYDSPAGTAIYMASLRKNGRHSCGGSIINTRWILTAAHCAFKYTLTNTTAIVGTDLRTSGGWEYFLSKIIIHPKFSIENFLNDIAMIKTIDNIEYNSLVGRINLPSYTTPPGTSLFLTGWGRLFQGGTAPTKLQKIRLLTISIPNCVARSSVSRPIWNKHICTYTQIGEGACNGDSGGPLIDDNGVLIGIVSWGLGCARGYPDINTNVYSYYDWIMNTADGNE